MCPHFGLLEDGGESRLCFLKRRKTGDDPRVFCRACGLSASLFADASVRPAVRHLLRQSLPFAACPKSDCPNRDVNVFERWGGAYRGGHQGADRQAAPGADGRLQGGPPAPAPGPKANAASIAIRFVPVRTANEPHVQGKCASP